MSGLVIYLELEDYLRDWLVAKYGNPVQFKKSSAESDILEAFLSIPPTGSIPDLPADNRVAISLPYFKHLDVRTYNYLPPKARAALVHCIKINFKVEMWSELRTFDSLDGCVTELIYAWMEKHGIDLTEKNWETIRQMYFRKRKIYRDQRLAKRSKKTPDFIEEN